MYIDQELITKYNEKKSRGMQKALLKELADKKLPVPQPVLTNIMQGKYPVNKFRHEVIVNFMKDKSGWEELDNLISNSGWEELDNLISNAENVSTD